LEKFTSSKKNYKIKKTFEGIAPAMVIQQSNAFTTSPLTIETVTLIVFNF
jgi:hypothetical protein